MKLKLRLRWLAGSSANSFGLCAKWFSTRTHTPKLTCFSTPPGRVCPTLFRSLRQLSIPFSLSVALLLWRGPLYPFHLQLVISFRLFRQLHWNRIDRHFSVARLCSWGALGYGVEQLSPKERETLGIWNTTKVGAHSNRGEPTRSAGVYWNANIKSINCHLTGVKCCSVGHWNFPATQSSRCKLFDQKCWRKCTNWLQLCGQMRESLSLIENGLRK